jgi:hypothetical protein
VCHGAVLHELLGDVAGGVDRDGEADADVATFGRGPLGQRGDGGVDADDLAVRVDQRPARVAGVDGRVGLDGVDDRGLARLLAAAERRLLLVALQSDGPVEGADDAGTHRAVEPERAADGEDGVADVQVVGVAERGGGEAADPVGLDDGQVGGRVTADDGGVGRRAVGEGHGQVAAVGRGRDDVVVGEDLTVLADDDARTAAAELVGPERDRHHAG